MKQKGLMNAMILDYLAKICKVHIYLGLLASEYESSIINKSWPYAYTFAKKGKRVSWHISSPIWLSPATYVYVHLIYCNLIKFF